jgi:ubiquinone/menaquinone biosynthesis C-methylase UbiE
MGDLEQRFSANVQQAEYWNSEPGQKWVQRDAEMDERLGPMTEVLIRRSGVRVGDHVLDIGCGGGSSTEQIAHSVGSDGRVVGIDISEPLLALARARCGDLSQVSFETADAQVHQFPKQGFDLLLSRFGVMFFSDPVNAFGNLFKALKPTGKFSTRTSEATSDVSADSGNATAKYAKSSSNATTEGSQTMRGSSLNSSKQMDTSLESSLGDLWNDYQARIIEPDTADQLIKEAYALSGPTLVYFAEELRVPTPLLAQSIIQSVPKRTSRSQLKSIMTYIVPALKQAHINGRV